jgi:putative oxidoreductase
MFQIDPSWSDRALSVLRIITALLFLQHGLAKLVGFPHVTSFDNLQLFSLLGLAGLIEIVGSLLLLVGLFTRPAAFIMSGEMAVAYFMAHAPQGFFPVLNQGELAVLYCFVFLFFAIAGGGSWSLDRQIMKSA